MKTVCFFGHKNIYGYENLFDLIVSKIEALIVSENVNQFLFGGYGRFDSLCHNAVDNLKSMYPHIKTIYVHAYLPYKKTEYDDLFFGSYDETLYPSIEEKPLKFAITYRNQEMIDMSDFCIFFVDHTWGGAYKTLLYAKRKKKNILNIAELINEK